jgi:hypothetical protein
MRFLLLGLSVDLADHFKFRIDARPEPDISGKFMMVQTH